MRHRITAFGVACAFLVCCVLMVGVMAFSGCATVKDYYTVDISMGDKVIATHFPNDVKEFFSENAYGFPFFTSHKIYAIRYWVTGSDFICDYWGELRTGKDIMIILWDEYGTFVKGWIYNDKGIPVKAYEETVMDLLDEIIGQKEVKGDSVWLNELEKQSEDAAKETDDIWNYLAKSLTELQRLVLELNRELVGE